MNEEGLVSSDREDFAAQHPGQFRKNASQLLLVIIETEVVGIRSSDVHDSFKCELKCRSTCSRVLWCTAVLRQEHYRKEGKYGETIAEKAE